MSGSSRKGGPEGGAALTYAVERPSPGIAALLEGVSEDRTHSLLDLGRPASPTLEVYGRFARWMRFSGILGAGTCDTSELEKLDQGHEPPYDLVFAWDVLDRVPPERRQGLMQRLAELSAPRARLYVLVNASEQADTRPMRFSLVDVGRMRYEPSGPPGPAAQRLQPGEIERVLMPFRVTRGFTLRPSFREYVAVLSGGGRHRGLGDGTLDSGGETVYLRTSNG